MSLELQDSGRAARSAVIALAVAAALIALAVVGHFAKPHGDFFEFRETGRALLRGDWPHTTKRGPVFPILIAALGSAIERIAPQVETPDARAAELVGAASLVAMAVLAALILLRWRCGGSVYWGMLILLIPDGFEWASLGLVEPLLGALVLATVYLRVRESKWAYAAASIASITRLDAIGLVIGLGTSNLLGDKAARRWRPHALLAALPPALLLAANVFAPGAQARDSYLVPILQTPTFHPAPVVLSAISSALPGTGLAIALADRDLQDRAATLLRGGFALAALAGVVLALRRRLAGSGPLIGFILGYVAAHAVYPFHVDRYGYPLSAVLVVPAALACREFAVWLWPKLATRWVRVGAATAAGLFLLAAFIGELDRTLLIVRRVPTLLLGIPGIAACFVLASCIGAAWRTRRIAPLFAAAALLALAVFQARTLFRVLGDGEEMRSLVDAAKWVESSVPKSSGVLSAVPGLLRLHNVADAPGRFVGLEEMTENDFAAIVRACPEAGIRYILWYDDLFGEQGEKYVRLWRLDRYAPLDAETPPAGLREIQMFKGPPRVRVFEILPETGR